MLRGCPPNSLGFVAYFRLRPDPLGENASGESATTDGVWPVELSAEFPPINPEPDGAT